MRAEVVHFQWAAAACVALDFSGGDVELAMKRCDTCGSTYADDSLGFCLTDGTALKPVSAPISDAEQAHSIRPHPSTQPTEILRGNVPPPWQPSAPAVWQGTQPAARSSNRLPWIIGGVALVLIFGLSAGLIFYVAQSRSDANPPNINSVNRNQDSRPPSNDNRNSSPPNVNQKPAEPPQPAAAPTDTEQVQSQLTELENDWNDANIKGDKAAITRILADEFRGVAANNSVEDKRQYLANLKPNTTISYSLTLSDLTVSLSGNTAVVTGLNTAKFKGGAKQVYRFTDTFIWRDGRWQAISSQATRVK